LNLALPKVNNESCLQGFLTNQHSSLIVNQCRKDRDRLRIEFLGCQWHVETAARSYLEPMRNSVQKPVKGLSSRTFIALKKGGGRHMRAEQTSFPALRNTRKVHPAPKKTLQHQKRPNLRRHKFQTQQRFNAIVKIIHPPNG